MTDGTLFPATSGTDDEGLTGGKATVMTSRSVEEVRDQ